MSSSTGSLAHTELSPLYSGDLWVFFSPGLKFVVIIKTQTLHIHVAHKPISTLRQLCLTAAEDRYKPSYKQEQDMLQFPCHLHVY